MEKLITMTVKLTKKQKIKVLNGEDVYTIMQEVLMRESKIDRNKEHLWVIALSRNDNILTIELVVLGTVKAITVEPMEIFSIVLQKRAVKMIIVHNHPSGNLDPSKSDIQMTDKIQAIASFLDVPLLDHLIISEKGFFSFMQTGLLEGIARESTFDLTFSKTQEMIDQIKNQQKLIKKLKLQLGRKLGSKK
jgi:DNA repair protein RadC